MKVSYLLLFYGVFVVLMEGKGQTYTEETLADYSEVRVQVFIAGVAVNRPASQASWRWCPVADCWCTKVWLHNMHS